MPGEPTHPTLPAGLASAPPSERLGRYIRAERLGAGGMGEVWKAWDTQLGRWVALKFLKGADSAEIERLRREAQTAATLNHPNIAAVYEVAEHDGRPFIAMQFVAGATLERYPRHDTRALVELLRDASLTVHHAHQRGVIHRDLKPANLMVEDGTRRLYVMDFGLAKQASVASSLSVSGLAVGTPSYMPPEQAAGRSRDVDARSDVYGLGATLYELLTDQPPFKGEDLYSLLMRVVDEEPRAPRRFKASIDPDLETIVLKCLEKDRARRYATAADLAADLTRWLGGEPISARAPSMLYRARKFVGKRRLAAALVAGLAVALVGAAFLARNLRRARGDAEEVRLYLPLEKDLDLLRMMFYRPDYRLTDADFAKYDALVVRIEEQMRATGESAQGRWLIGRCREVLCDYDSAETVYRRALQLDAEHAPTLLSLGRLHLERALLSRVTGGAVGREARRAEEGAALIERARAGDAMMADLARCHLHAIRHWGRSRDPGPARELAEKWRDRPFSEEFVLVSGMTGTNEDLLQPATTVIGRMPSWSVAYFWRSMTGANPEADLTRAVEINPRFAEAYVQRGALRSERNDFAGALADFEAALNLRPQNAAYLVNIAAARLQLGDLSAAQAAVDRSLALRPDSADAFHVQAKILLARDDGAAALRAIDRALQLEATDGAFLTTRAQIRIVLRDYAGAIADTDAALRVTKTSTAYALRANAKRHAGDLEGAEADAQSAAALSEDAGTLMVRAWVHLRKGRANEALADAAKAATLKPRDPELLSQQAEILYLANRNPDALAVHELVMSLRTPVATDFAGRGIVLRELGRAAESLKDFERAIALDPRCAPALIGRALHRLDAGDADAALRDLDAAIEADPANGSAWRMRARAYSEKNDTTRALADYAEALRINPRDYASLNNRAEIYSRAGDLEGALTDLDRCLAIEPRLVEAWITRGAVHFAQRRVDDALEDFTKALTIDPKRANAWFNRGSLRRLKGDAGAAIGDLTKAIELDPSETLAWYYRALARQDTHDFENAIADLDETLKRQKDHHEAFANRGICHKNLGRRDKAKADLERALQLAPADWPARRQVEDLLKGL